MSANRKIFPWEPPPITEVDRQRVQVPWKFGGFAWLSFALFLAIASAGGELFPAAFTAARPSSLIGSLILVAVGTSLAITLSYAEYKSHKSLQNLIAKRKSDIEGEAKALTMTASSLLEEAPSLADRLPVLATTAHQFLIQAERDYRDNAFGPFWDAIEKAAVTLYSFRHNTKEIEVAAQRYFDCLGSHGHTFPPYPLRVQSIPDLLSAVENYRRLLRQGQTNFRFAVIWEQRKTRKTIIEGFRNLGDAIDGAAFGLHDSIEQLHATVRSRGDL